MNVDRSQVNCFPLSLLSIRLISYPIRSKSISELGTREGWQVVTISAVEIGFLGVPASLSAVCFPWDSLCVVCGIYL